MRAALAAVVVVTLTACSSAPGENGEELGSTSEALTDVCPTTTTLGIDIASFQHPNGAAINWTQVATGRKFVFVKATEGTTYANTYYTGDVNGARAAGLLVGAYAVVAPQSQSGKTGAQQAAYFLAHSQHKAGDLPPLLDVEPFAEYNSVLPEKQTVLDWLTAVETALGRKPMVYIRPDLIADLGTPAALGQYPIDVPNYSTCPGYPNSYPVKNLMMWQYTSTASIPGITGNVDAIKFYGDLTALKAFANDASDLPHASGYLDKVACDEIAGWDYDPNAKTKSTTVKITFDGKTDETYPASNDRADLMTPIGSTNHGFSTPPPRSLLDGKAHTVDAYAVALETGVVGDKLTTKTTGLNCPNPAIAEGAVKRWVTSPTVFDAWKLDSFTDTAPEPDAALDAVTKGVDITAGPDVVIADDGTPDVWVIDQGKRRHVVNPASMTAWRFTAAKTPAAMVNGFPQGPNWPATPELVKGTAAEVYMLDVDINAPITATPDSPSGTAPPSTTDGTSLDAPSADADHGCASAPGGGRSGGLGVAALALCMIAGLRRRRADRA